MKKAAVCTGDSNGFCTLAQCLASGEGRSAGQVLDRLEAKYAALVDVEKMIGEITDDNLHQEVGFGKPVGKEGL